MLNQGQDLKPGLCTSAAKVVRRLGLTIQVSVIDQTDLNVGPALKANPDSQQEWVGVCENSCSHESNLCNGEKTYPLEYEILAFRAGDLDDLLSNEFLNPLEAGLSKYQQDHPTERLQRWFDFGIKPTRFVSEAKLIHYALVYYVMPNPDKNPASSYDSVVFFTTQIEGECLPWELYPGETVFYKALAFIDKASGSDKPKDRILWFDKDVWFLNRKPDQKGEYS